MTRKTLLALGLIAATVVSGAAYAAGNHGRAGQQGNAGMMGGHADMMNMMMRMHGQMMGGMGPMGGMMPGAFDADGDGKVTADEVRAGLEEKLTEYDSDGDKMLSIAEFEMLHSAMVRETMVDRFQHLDNDGDGKITAVEIAASAERMERMQMMRMQMPGAGPDRQDMGQGHSGKAGQRMGDENGSMMDDN